MKTNSYWLVPALLLAAAVSSCTAKNEYSSLEILKLVSPTSSEAADAGNFQMSCTYSATSVEPPIETFNTSRDFSMGIVMTNNLVTNANAALGRLNTNDFIATQAVTTYEATDGSSFSIAQQIEPMQGTCTVGSTCAFGAVLIPAVVASQLATVSSVRLHVHVEGRLLDGSSISTNEYLPVASPTSSDDDSGKCQGLGN